MLDPDRAPVEGVLRIRYVARREDAGDAGLERLGDDDAVLELDPGAFGKAGARRDADAARSPSTGDGGAIRASWCWSRTIVTWRR